MHGGSAHGNRLSMQARMVEKLSSRKSSFVTALGLYVLSFFSYSLGFIVGDVMQPGPGHSLAPASSGRWCPSLTSP